jgi:hypothetical protein
MAFTRHKPQEPVVSGRELFDLCYAAPNGSVWEVQSIGHSASSASLALDQQGLPHILSMLWLQGNLACISVPQFSLTGIRLYPEGAVELRWQGAVQGVNVDAAESPLGPWQQITNDLSGLGCFLDAPMPNCFFRLRKSH